MVTTATSLWTFGFRRRTRVDVAERCSPVTTLNGGPLVLPKTWLGSGPLDLTGEQRSIRPGRAGTVRVYPMDPAAWRGVEPSAVLHLRERVGQTLGIGVVLERVGVPDHASLRLDVIPLRGGEVLLTPHEDDQVGLIAAVVAFILRLRRGARQ